MANTTEYWEIMQKSLEKKQNLTTAKRVQASTKKMRADEFRQALVKYDQEFTKLQEEANERRKAENKKYLEKREREKRINEIRGLLAHYRRKLAFNKNDSTALAMVSELENKLFWLMFGL